MYSTGYKLSNKIEVRSRTFWSLFHFQILNLFFRANPNSLPGEKFFLRFLFSPERSWERSQNVYSPIYSPQSISFPMYSTGYKLSDKIEVQFCSLFSISKSKSTFQSQTKFSSCRQILFAIPFHPQNVLQNVLRMFYSPI